MMAMLIAGLVTTAVVAFVYGVASFAPARPRAVSRRLARLEASGPGRVVIERRRRQARRERMEALLEAFGEKVSGRRAEWSQVQRRLVQAGFRRPNAVSIYFGARVLATGAVGTGVCLLARLGGRSTGITLLAIGLSALGTWILPRVWLSRKIRKRQHEIRRALPDTLDLMVVCVEAGLGLNAAIVRVSDEIEHVSRTMSDELTLTNLEIRAGTPRDEALRNLGERTGVADVRSLTAMLIQTDRFGTSVATALRVHADTMRTKRRQRAEEAAAKTTIKLVFPLVLFIFPSMFVVILGPAVLNIIQQLKGLT